MATILHQDLMLNLGYIPYVPSSESAAEYLGEYQLGGYVANLSLA